MTSENANQHEPTQNEEGGSRSGSPSCSSRSMADGELEKLSKILQEHEKEIRSSRIGLDNRLRLVLDHYQRIAERSLAESRAFRDDFVTWLRAVQLNLAIIEGGYTHAEKNARLRGFEELISQCIGQLRDREFDLSWSHCREYPDMFDPVERRKFLMIDGLKDENRRLKAQLSEAVDE